MTYRTPRIHQFPHLLYRLKAADFETDKDRECRFAVILSWRAAWVGYTFESSKYWLSEIQPGFRARLNCNQFYSFLLYLYLPDSRNTSKSCFSQADYLALGLGQWMCKITLSHNALVTGHVSSNNIPTQYVKLIITVFWSVNALNAALPFSQPTLLRAPKWRLLKVNTNIINPYYTCIKLARHP